MILLLFEEYNQIFVLGHPHVFRVQRQHGMELYNEQLLRAQTYSAAYLWSTDQFGTNYEAILEQRRWVSDPDRYLLAFREPLDVVAFKIRWC